LQLLGQAWLYEDDLRRAYNAHSRAIRELFVEGDESAHVREWLYLQHKTTMRTLRKSRGHLLDCGTYWLIEAAMLQASKASGLDPIRARPWDGSGRIGAAIQSVDQFPAAEWAHKRVSLSAPDAKGHALLSIVIGELKTARTITWPVKIHRPLPPDAVVKQVAVQRTRNGHRFRWDATITIAYEDTRDDSSATGVVGVDIGWCYASLFGTRAATDSAGGEALSDTRESFEYADAVRGTRDRYFDAVKKYVKGAGLEGAEHAHLWKNKARMHNLAKRTADLGPAWWAYRDRHLEDIECGVRSRAVRRRTDTYRRYADSLAKRFRVVALEDMPMLDWVGEGKTHAKERKRSMAALSELQNAIVQRFGPGRVDWVPCAYTSRTCSACGVDSGLLKPQEFWTCTACGAVHQRDYNAAVNIRANSERWIGAGNPVRARKRKAKKGKGKGKADAIRTIGEGPIVATPREPLSNAAE
jgi:hypothetical protein